MKNIKDYNLDSLKEEFVQMGEKPFRAEQVFKWLYEEKVKEFDEMTNLSLQLREKLKENYTMCNFKILRKLESSDGTKKYLFDLLDGNAIETVLMSYHHGYSICVSSQVGCKMGCKFCASTGIPFVRNLTSGEIVEQILAVEQDNNIRISNVVFMGIGEPLNNYNNVVNAIRIINNPKGINIGARHISVSTSGLVPAIYRLADENIQCTLSISLHATTNEKRSSMMPVNNAFPIEELLQACKDYIAKTNRRISFEYALAKDNNDNLDDAKELVHLLKGMLCHVNLIPINKIENGTFEGNSTNGGAVDLRTMENKEVVSGGSFSNQLQEDYLAANVDYKVYSGGMTSYFTDINDAVAAATEDDIVEDFRSPRGDGEDGYIVRLEDNNAVVAQIHSFATSVSLPTLSKSGYTFKGWKDAEGKTYTSQYNIPTASNGEIIPPVSDAYVLTAVWSANSYYYYPSTSDTTTSTTTKGSPKTFDAGVGIYAVTAVLSVTGMAWAGKKRH